MAVIGRVSADPFLCFFGEVVEVGEEDEVVFEPVVLVGVEDEVVVDLVAVVEQPARPIAPTTAIASIFLIDTAQPPLVVRTVLAVTSIGAPPLVRPLPGGCAVWLRQGDRLSAPLGHHD